MLHKAFKRAYYHISDMAKIWFSICGEGMGHAIRSNTILEELTKKHDILITAYGRAFDYLNKKFENVHKIKGVHYVYENNEVKLAKSVGQFFKKLPKNTAQNIMTLFPLLYRFRPEIIISDFESTANYISKLLRIPCIYVDNIHALTECRIDLKQPIYLKPVMKVLHPTSTYYIISSFAALKPKDSKRCRIVTPVVRKEVRKLVPEDKNFILVYQTSETNTKMLPILRSAPERFKIYGMGKHEDEPNLKFMPFSEDTFLKDLRDCSYVIVNGGFTVITEALFLKKPVLSIPIGKQPEQEFNAYCIEEYGYGAKTDELTSEDIKSFRSELDHYKKNLEKMRPWDFQEFFDHIEKLIRKYSA